MIPYSRLRCYEYPVKMLRETLILLFCVLMAADISPIGEKSQIRLQSVADGEDSRGEGFAALVEHVRGWEGSVESLKTPNMASLLITPELFRGKLFQISGDVELLEPLAYPWSGVQELFVRGESGNVYGVYVVGESSTSSMKTIQGPALFYKTMSIKARDNQIRLYPTFVTTDTVLKSSMRTQKIPTSLLVIPLFFVVLFVFFLVVKLCKGKRKLNPRKSIVTREVIDAVGETSGELPEDPSKAMAMLYEDSEGKA